MDHSNEGRIHFLENKVDFDKNFVRKEVRLFLNELVSSSPGRDERRSYWDTMDYVAELAGDEQAWNEERKYTKKIRQILVIFAEEIAEYARDENKRNPIRFNRLQSYSERTQHYSVIFEQTFLSGSPCLFSGLSAIESFNTVVKFDQIPNLETSISNRLFDDLSYKLAFASPNYFDQFLQEVISSFNSVDVAHQVAIIKKLLLLGENAVNAGYDAAFEIGSKLVDYLYIMSDGSKTPIAGMTAYAAAEQLKNTVDFEISGEVTDVSFQYMMDTAKQSLKKRYNSAQKYSYPDKVLGRGEELRTIASDYVAIYGENGRPVELASRVDGAAFVDTQVIFDLPTNIPFGSQEQIKDIRYLFEQIQSPLFCTLLESLLGVDLSKLSLRNQIQLINFISSRTVEQYDEILNLKEEGRISDSFYKGLFAINSNKEIGDALVECAKNNDSEVVNNVCDKYNELVESIIKIEDRIKNFFSNSDNKKIDTRSAVQEFSKRAAQLFQTALKEPKRADELFKDIQSDIFLFSSVFKTAVKNNPDIKLQEVANIEIKVTNQHELSEQDKEQMKSIIARNWKDRRDGLLALKSFNDFLEGDVKSILYVLKRGGEVVAFVRYDQMQNDDGSYIEGEKYGASFNIDPAYKTSALGASLFDESMRLESEKNNITAVIGLDYGFTSHYIEDFGFIITDGTVEDAGKVADFVMHFSHENSGKFLSRSSSISIEDILERKVGFDTMHISVEPNSAEFDDDQLAVTKKLKEGNVITRFIVDPKDSTKRYIVFEKNYSLLNATEPALFKAAA